MALSVIYKPVGPTAALSVVATAHTPVAVTSNPGEFPTFALLINPSATVTIYATVTPLLANATAPTSMPYPATFPVDGTPSGNGTAGVILPPLMTQPIAIPVPNSFGQGFAISAIGSAAGPTIMYVTPVVAQS